MIANWDGRLLTVCGMQQAAGAAMQFASQHDDMDICELTPNTLDTQVDYLLWPIEDLLVRNVSFDLPHVKLIDQDILGNEIEEACDEDASQWWLSSSIAKREDRITGLLFALAKTSRDALTEHMVWKQCKYLLPDVWVRLASLLNEHLDSTQAVIDEDDTGVCVGVFDAQGCCALRRINKTAWRNDDMMAEEVRRSLCAMQVTEADCVVGRCGTELYHAMNVVFSDWQVRETAIPARAEANIAALRGCLAVEKNKLQAANLRHGSWAKQKKFQIDWQHWRVAMSLAVVAILLLFTTQGLQSSQLKAHNQQLEQALEMTFRAALPEGPKNYEPLAQLQQAAGKVSDVDAWYFLDQLASISQLLLQVPELKIDKIQFKKGDMFLSARVKDFAAVNHVQDILADLLQRKVQVADTELDGQKMVRFRVTWS